MLSYVLIAFACFVAALICLWLFRAVAEVGKAAYHAILPSASRYRKPASPSNR